MVEIYTLGNFDIRLEDVSILKAVGNKQRLVKLLKYLLTFHGKKLLPERIIEDLWQDEYTQPLRALRTQISRVKRCGVLRPFLALSTLMDTMYSISTRTAMLTSSKCKGVLMRLIVMEATGTARK